MAEIPRKEVQIEAGWKHVLAKTFEEDWFRSIKAFLLKEKKAGKTIFPPGPFIFNAFNTTPFDQVKVVILGQDPYHGPGQAMGLSFSVPQGVPIPASLRNIFKELGDDLQVPFPKHGDLSLWAKQGVFLLNAILTVEKGRAGSHARIGWERFTDEVIRALSEKREGIIFLLWGNFARSKKPLIDQRRHFVLEAAHPSPLARNAFMGCRHFSKTNEILKKLGNTEIIWQL